MSEVATTGRLYSHGHKQLGVGQVYEYFGCGDCGSMYPKIGHRISCNGHEIHLCPWCRPDSEPWKHGRGV